MTRADLDSLFERADRQYEASNFRSAFRLFLSGAQAGDSSCQINLGNLFANGTGVKPNSIKARHWYMRAWRKGHAAAASNIAIDYRNAGNVKRALAWFERAAKSGDGDANLEIAKIYLARNETSKAVHYLRETRKAESVTEWSEEEAEKLLASLGIKFGKRRRRSWR